MDASDLVEVNVMKLFIIGFIIGDFFGFLITALMAVAGNEDRCMECRQQKQLDE